MLPVEISSSPRKDRCLITSDDPQTRHTQLFTQVHGLSPEFVKRISLRSHIIHRQFFPLLMRGRLLMSANLDCIRKV